MQEIKPILPFNESDRLGSTGEKIVADRYLQKGGELKEGALVVAVVDKKTSLHELGEVLEITENSGKKMVKVRLRDEHEIELPSDQMEVLKETAPRQMWDRIASGLALGDKKMKDSFTKLLSNFKYIPGGRINASMGSVDKDGNSVKTTSYNCFVIPNVGPLPKDYAISFGRTLEIQARSGGVGMNLSMVPPQGTLVEPKVLNRSDLQLVMDVWHPDLFEFLDENYPNSTKLVRINDEFKQALEEDAEYTLEFPDTKTPNYDKIWDGDLAKWKKKGLKTITAQTLSALDLYEQIIAKGVAIVDGLIFAKEVNPRDSRETIADALAEQWELQIGGKKVAIRLSSLRPRYNRVIGVNGRSSGAYSWGTLYDKGNWAYAQGFGPVAVAEIMSTGCLLIIQGGSRRGALMIVLNDWHQDIQKFIDAKRDMSLINGANISVGLSDEFMDAVHSDADWNTGLVNQDKFDKYEFLYEVESDDFVVTNTLKATEIWDQIMHAAWASAEPGVIFLGRANKISNSGYYAQLLATNPCGKLA